jgi:uncharacterized protein YbaR (Trm112 family)
VKVRCIHNKAESLPPEILEKLRCPKDTEFLVTVSKEYTVYCIYISMGYIEYTICDNEHDPYYSHGYPAFLFDVVDPRLSKWWVYSFFKESYDSSFVYITYPEWAQDPYYYNRLIDGDEEAMKAFKHYKQLMDLEYPDSSIPEKDTALVTKEERWLICPSCLEGWEELSNSGMVICPRCKRVLHNPFFEKWDERGITKV